MPGKFQTDSLALIVGQLQGQVELVITSLEINRQERIAGNEKTSKELKEVREQLSEIALGLKVIEPITRRLDAIDDETLPHSLKARFLIVENDARDQKTKMAMAVGIFTGAIVLIGWFIKEFGPEIKSLLFRLFKVA